jgi:hypothetical protein
VLRKFKNPGVRAEEETKAALSDGNDIARTQLIRFRRRLGSLTHEPELQIKNLLISTVTKVYLVRERIIKAMIGNGLTESEWLETRQYKQEPDDS